MNILQMIRRDADNKPTGPDPYDMADALDHIIRVCHGSREQTRRIRWIAERARCGLDGSTDWKTVDLPASADSQAKKNRRLSARIRELEDKIIELEKEREQ